MPLTPEQAALWTSSAQMMGNAANAIAQGRTNKRTREWNEKMYARQRADALMDWNMQNEYNSPEAQMARLKAAGLNPNLVYGNGAVNTGATVRSSSVESWKPEAPQFNIQDTVGAGLSAYYDIQLRGAQVDAIHTGIENTKKDIELKTVQMLKMFTDVDRTKIKTEQEKLNLFKAEETLGIYLDKQKEELRRLRTGTDVMISTDSRNWTKAQQEIKESAMRIIKMRQDNAKTAQETKNLQVMERILGSREVVAALDAKLAKEGQRPGDNMVFRKIGQLLDFLERKISSGQIWDDLKSMINPFD